MELRAIYGGTINQSLGVDARIDQTMCKINMVCTCNITCKMHD